MNKSICGADCESCSFGQCNSCKGCQSTNGCPFGKACFIAGYIKVGGLDAYHEFKKQIISEFNAIEVEGMAEITELYALNGAFVNLEYTLPSGEKQKLLDDRAIYLGTQTECMFSDKDNPRCFGLVAAQDFLLVSEYGADGSNPEIVAFKRR